MGFLNASLLRGEEKRISLRSKMPLQHGCRPEYGALELRIQPNASSNRFVVYVDDSHLEHPCVYEQSVQSTLEAAKEYLNLRAAEYLKSYEETPPQQVHWRCS